MTADLRVRRPRARSAVFIWWDSGESNPVLLLIRQLHLTDMLLSHITCPIACTCNGILCSRGLRAALLPAHTPPHRTLHHTVQQPSFWWERTRTKTIPHPYGVRYRLSHHPGIPPRTSPSRRVVLFIRHEILHRRIMWSERRDSNPQVFRHRFLRPARLPFRHSRMC